MNILIAGCGRVGAGLANALYKEGHDVSVVDRDPESFVLLEDSFTGFRLVGNPIDSVILRRAGIEECHLVAAVTGDDNTNLMVAQIARELFQVPKVLTRLYDPARQDIYEHQEGLHTVCPTNLTVDLIQQIISQADQDSARVVFGNNTISLSALVVPASHRGKTLAQVGLSADESIVGVLRKEGAILFHEEAGHYRLKKGDRVLCARLV